MRLKVLFSAIKNLIVLSGTLCFRHTITQLQPILTIKLLIQGITLGKLYQTLGLVWYTVHQFYEHDVFL